MFETEEGKWSIGRVLQFAKLITHHPYKDMCINLSHAKGMGVLCSWFVAQEGSTRVFKLFHNPGVTHTYIPLSKYVCTLTLQCVDVEQSVADPTLLQNVVSRTIGDSNSHERRLALAQEFHLKAESEQFISSNLKTDSTSIIITISNSSDEDPESCSKGTSIWKKIDQFHLYKS